MHCNPGHAYARYIKHQVVLYRSDERDNLHSRLESYSQTVETSGKVRVLTNSSTDSRRGAVFGLLFSEVYNYNHLKAILEIKIRIIFSLSLMSRK